MIQPFYEKKMLKTVKMLIRGATKAKMCFIFGHKFCLSPRQS